MTTHTTTSKPGSFADLRRGSRHARGYGKEWTHVRVKVLQRDCYVCQCHECKANGHVKTADQVDHRVPKYLGGTDDMDNLQAINKHCHMRKTLAESAAARGAAAPKHSAACRADGLPTDPAHPWAAAGAARGPGGANKCSNLQSFGTVLPSQLARRRYSMGGAS